MGHPSSITPLWWGERSGRWTTNQCLSVCVMSTVHTRPSDANFDLRWVTSSMFWSNWLTTNPCLPIVVWDHWWPELTTALEPVVKLINNKVVSVSGQWSLAVSKVYDYKKRNVRVGLSGHCHHRWSNISPTNPCRLTNDLVSCHLCFNKK